MFFELSRKLITDGQAQRIPMSLSTLTDNKQDIPITQEILYPIKKGIKRIFLSSASLVP